MSYSAQYKNHSAFLNNNPTFVSGEIPADAFAAAQKAVEAIISSGAVSRQAAHDHAISIYGHANPDHEFTPGLANDSLTVSVCQVPVEVPKPAPAVEQVDEREPEGAPVDVPDEIVLDEPAE